MKLYLHGKGYPWNDADPDVSFNGMDGLELAALLPHGSGINASWTMEKEMDHIVAYNTYSAMDDVGGYCCDYDFAAVFDAETGENVEIYFTDDYDPEDDGCDSNCGHGLTEYLDDMFALVKLGEE